MFIKYQMHFNLFNILRNSCHMNLKKPSYSELRILQYFTFKRIYSLKEAIHFQKSMYSVMYDELRIED